MFVLQPKGEDKNLFTPRFAEAIEKLTEKSWQMPYSIRVDSLSNFQHTWSSEDDLTVEDLILDGESLTAEQLKRKKQVALAEPLLNGNLLSKDGNTTGVNVTFNYPEKSIMEVPETAAAARAIRSVWGTIATLFVIMFATVSAMGIAGYAEIKLLPVSALAPTIILTLAIADSIHVLVVARKMMTQGMGKIEAIKESVRVNLLPVFITSVTTIIGFLALNFSDSPPFHHLGNITAVGIVMALILSVGFLPAMMSLVPIKGGKPMAEGKVGWVERYSNFLIARYKQVLLAGGVVTVAIAGSVIRCILRSWRNLRSG